MHGIKGKSGSGSHRSPASLQRRCRSKRKPQFQMADRAMLAAPVLLVLLPLALAGCPCPPAPAASKVCGSNFVTYDSQCHLDCAALPGLSVAYPGPCSLRGVMSRLNVTLPSAPAAPVDPRRRTSARSAWDDLQEYTVCEGVNECPGQSCQPACGTSGTCKTKCEMNCECNCLKMPGSDANPDNAKLVNDCITEKKCFSTMTSCNFKCTGGTECMASCTMDFMKCGCECNRLGSSSGGGGGSGGGNDDKKGGSAPGATLGATTAVALTATWLARALAAAAW